MDEPLRRRVHHNPIVLSDAEIEKAANAIHIVSLQQERAGMDVRVLNRANKKILEAKYGKHEIEIPEERLRWLE